MRAAEAVFVAVLPLPFAAGCAPVVPRSATFSRKAHSTIFSIGGVVFQLLLQQWQAGLPPHEACLLQAALQSAQGHSLVLPPVACVPAAPLPQAPVSLAWSCALPLPHAWPPVHDVCPPCSATPMR